MAVKAIKGSVRPRPNKKDVRYYSITLELGKDKITGKRKRVSFRCETTDRAEADAMLILKQAEYMKGDMLMPSDMTVEQIGRAHV